MPDETDIETTEEESAGAQTGRSADDGPHYDAASDAPSTDPEMSELDDEHLREPDTIEDGPGVARGSAQEPEVGRLFARRYVIEEKLGEGASGAVFRATHELMHKTVAIKLLHSDLVGDVERVERFRREAQATAAIDHPNVCGATDIDRLPDGRLFMVMEYLEGQTLTERINEAGSLGFDEAVQIVDQVAHALERAHGLDIVHRDLKPDNIYLVDEPNQSVHVKILDFGLARVSFPEDIETLTLPGVVAGTPKYFSPEQCEGETVDGRSDLYTLGLVFYQMVTGAPPFTSSDVRTVMHQHIHEQPAPPSTVADRLIPFSVERLIDRLLKKNPEERIQTAAELRRDLAALDLTDSSSPAPLKPLPGSSAARKHTPTSTRGVLVGLAAVLVLVVIVVVAVTSGNSADEAAESPTEPATESELSAAAERYLQSASQRDRAILADNMTATTASLLASESIAAPFDDNTEPRLLVRALLEDSGGLQELEPWQQLGVRLRAEDMGDCAARKPIVREIHKLGDPRLLPLLERLKSSKLDNGCMERTLPRAIGVLRMASDEQASE